MTEQDFKIFNNILHYYTLFCENGKILHGKEKGIYWFKNKPSKWPNWTLGQNFDSQQYEQETIEIIEKIKNKSIPPFWNLTPGKLQQECGSVLEQNGFRLIFRWIGMTLKQEEYKPSNKIQDKNLVIKPVVSIKELEDFHYLINNFILDSRKIDLSLLKGVLYSEKVKMFIAYYKNIPVSTAKLFFKDNIAGLYLIATNESFRGKGFGTFITRTAIDYAFEKNANELVLHASSKGYPIYQKMGFQEQGKYNIYWLMGKEYR